MLFWNQPTSSERFNTDILLGLPGETLDSHLMSLNRAYELGFDSISGGEIRLLPGSALETDKSRRENGITTKYRLVQEGFGIYKGHFVAEFEESVRSTKWITEQEMLRLRILRALFYGAITIGELSPLMKYLRDKGINVIKVIEELIEGKDADPLVAESIGWLHEKAQGEWFDTREEGTEFFSNADNQKKLLDNPTIKLNFDFWSYLILSKERREAFYRAMERTLSRYAPVVDSDIVRELLGLCQARNYVVQCLRGVADTQRPVPLSGKTIQQLTSIKYIDSPKAQEVPNTVMLTMDEPRAESIRNALQASEVKIQTISLLCQQFQFRVFLEPAVPA